MPPTAPIDPLEGPKLGLSGRVVTMDADYTVIERGTVWIEQGAIVAVAKTSDPPPEGFEDVRPVATQGTIYPGLIELHNHLSYNALRLWDVPKRFVNRDQWAGIPEYRKLVSGPMQVLGPSPELMPAVVRFVECKCLVSGTTTSQGIELFSNAGARRYYRGIVRNVERTDDPDLPEASCKIADVDASSALSFLNRLRKKQCFILHLSEGTDEAARRHFLALRISPRRWAIADSLTGIHCAALKREDFRVMGRSHASMVWSPLSNLLLYGDTAKVKEARDAGLRIGLGSDWSPTGSKNLLGELKVAKVVSDAAGGMFEDRELLAMATREAAAILRWDRALGTIEPGKRADLLVLDSANGDPYGSLLRSDERSVHGVLIGGVPRFGVPSLLSRLGAEGEEVSIGGRKRILNLRQLTADPAVGAIPLAEARDRLRDALARIKELRREQERKGFMGLAPPTNGELSWGLALDELQPSGLELRPRLPWRRKRTGPTLAEPHGGPPLSELMVPLELDALTVADDRGFLKQIEAERNLPPFVAPGLKALYPA
jgi:5-methylthioadenosine/S-adenosylhomocysteine deaminase